VALSIAQVSEYLHGPEGVKMFRYSMASVVALITSVLCLAILNGPLGTSAVMASTLATAVATVPSYYLNRRWAWGKDGRSHFWKEVVPFWALAFMGWALSTYSVRLMEAYAKHHQFSHVLRTASVTFVYIGAFGVLWVGKFVIFNKVLFVHRGDHLVELAAEMAAEPGV
jgi:putative flippase GtrA